MNDFRWGVIFGMLSTSFVWWIIHIFRGTNNL
jgi:hypothetical protein